MLKIKKLGAVFGIRALSISLLFSSQLIVARISNPEEFGLYAIWLTLVNLGGVFIKYGVDTGAIKYFAIYSNSLSQSFSYRQYAYTKMNKITLFTMIFVIIFAITLSGFKLIDYMHYLLIFHCSYFLARIQYRRGEFIGLGMPVLSEVGDAILKPLLIVIVNLAVLYGLNDINITTMCISFLFAITLVNFISYIITKLTINLGEKEGGPDDEWQTTTNQMAHNVFVRQIIKSSDILVCGLLLPVSDVALYAIATRLADVVVFALTSANLIFAPNIAKLYNDKKKSELNVYLKDAARLVFFIGAIAFILCVFLGETVLSLYGSQYKNAYYLLLTLAGGQLINAYFGPTGYLASMTGHQKELTKALITASFISLVLYFILLPLIGVIGAAFSSSIGTVLWNILIFKRLSQKEGLISKAF